MVQQEEGRPERPEARGEVERRRGEQVAVQSNDESIATLQLAARWAERFAPAEGDTLEAMLARFRRAYGYVDAVIHGVEPAESEE